MLRLAAVTLHRAGPRDSGSWKQRSHLNPGMAHKRQLDYLLVWSFSSICDMRGICRTTALSTGPGPPRCSRVAMSRGASWSSCRRIDTPAVWTSPLVLLSACNVQIPGSGYDKKQGFFAQCATALTAKGSISPECSLEPTHPVSECITDI